MVVTDPDDRCLLARNAQWPPRRVSVLAGFVEPGESAEQAVAREVHEETGVVVGAVTYAGSQPWPMPHNLMLGFRAEATGTDITVDEDEIAEASWYSRDDLREALVSGALLMPPSLSISRWLIETWYGGDLPRPDGGRLARIRRREDRRLAQISVAQDQRQDAATSAVAGWPVRAAGTRRRRRAASDPGDQVGQPDVADHPAIARSSVVGSPSCIASVSICSICEATAWTSAAALGSANMNALVIASVSIGSRCMLIVT